jgi:hypothetical protein
VKFGPHKKSSKGIGCWTVLVLCALFLAGFVILFWDDGGFITLEGIWDSIWDERQHSAENRRLFNEIRRVEALGGAEASEELFKIALSGPKVYRSRMETFAALGRLGRPEDVPELIKRFDWYSQPVSDYMPYVASALGQIGGEEACLALNHKFLVQSEEMIYQHQHHSKYRFYDLPSLATAINEAQCLPQEEINRLVKRIAFDMWTAEWLMMPSLENLANGGDEQARSLIQVIAHPPDVTKTSLVQFREILDDPAVPMFVRERLLGHLINRTESKRQLIDFLLERHILRRKAAPDNLRGWPGRVYWPNIVNAILNDRISSWDGLPETYLQDWAKKIPSMLPEDEDAAAYIVQKLIGLEGSHVRNRTNYESRTRVEEAGKR